MNTALITGSNGLIGSEASKFFHRKGFRIIGIDNDMRRYFFGAEASTRPNRTNLQNELENYYHYAFDIRDYNSIEKIFNEYEDEIEVIIHTAAQPSHDWAAREPFVDFTINANGTLNLLEATRKYCPEAVFIFTSTNKVYGDLPNYLTFVEHEERWELKESHPFFEYGIDESMSVDCSMHSLFGVSKLAADILVQEYGKYLGMKTGIFRGGCLTGPAHTSAELHGFLAYLVLCAVKHKPYTIFGYRGKQVRDNIHSYDLINCFFHFFQNPMTGRVYNIGGSRHSNSSILEAIRLIYEISGYRVKYKILDESRKGDHIWYISDVRKFKRDYPSWDYEYNMETIIKDLIAAAEKE